MKLERQEMTPEIMKQLVKWNDARRERNGTQAGIDTLRERALELDEQMRTIETIVNRSIPELDSPVGVKIGDDFVVVIDYNSCVGIEVIDFKTSEELL
jgi:hypothetical protein